MMLFLPEIVTLLGTLVVFIMSLADVPYRTCHRAAVVMAGVVLLATALSLDQSGQAFFDGIYTVDIFSQLLKLGLAIGLLLTVMAAADAETVRASVRLDLPFFMFVSTAGMMMLVSATELLTLYVALELSAYGMFILVALHRNQVIGSEAGIKYLIYGAASSAVTLYGLSLIFGIAGSTYISDIATSTAANGTPIFYVGVLLALSGFLFKLAVFPFHSWAPDAYEGSPHQVATFVGTVSKVAAVGVLVRACTMSYTNPGDLFTVFFVLAAVSMTFGNLAALVQRDIKRLLAYSTIAHAGYIMVGLYAFSVVGIASALFYGLVYLLMAFCAFAVVCAVGRDGHNPTFDSLKGLHKRSPFLAMMLLVAMFGLAGIPPTPGFAGKWFLFAAALQRGQLILVLIAAVNAAISLYYYLIVVKAAFVEASDDTSPIAVDPSLRIAGLLALIAVLLLGTFPGPLWDMAVSAAQAVISVTDPLALT